MVNRSHIKDSQEGASASAFGVRLRETAGRLGYNAADLARMANIAKQSMSAYWNGTRLCGADRLFALADILRVEARWLVEGDAPPRTENETAEDAELLRALALLDARARAVLVDVARVMAGMPDTSGYRLNERAPGYRTRE